MGRRVALLVATYEYQDPGLRQLTAPAQDAEALADVLRDPAIAGFEVTTLVNEPHHRVGEAIGDFYRDRRRNDLTLLYFTGHGLDDDHGRLYLAMTNTRRDSLLFTGLAAELVNQAMDGCMSGQKVLVLDCCYAGAFPMGRLAKADSAMHTLERFQGRGITVLTASDAAQYSFEGDQALGRSATSVFTRHLVAGLRDGSADQNGDGDITLDELYGYVHDRVVREMPQQRSKMQTNIEGRTVIARNVNWRLPDHLRHSIDSPIAAIRLSALEGLAHLYRSGNDSVRSIVHEKISHLADDDSKSVSAAAAAYLESLHGEASVQPVPTESPGQAPATPEPTPAPPQAAARLVQLASIEIPEPGNAVTFSPDGEHLAVACDMKIALIAELTGTVRHRLKHGGLIASVWSVDYSPDGRRLATGSGDKTARIWDAATGVEVLKVRHQDTVASVAFSPDGRHLATASLRTAEIWDATSGSELFTMNHPEEDQRMGTTGVAFSADGRRVVTVRTSARIHLWQLPEM
ncbi:WD domain-containing protein, G-beta repeat-containing protein [Nonomuraea wenchangensis]|uniref:WD domain-containing protein, G-beta repeat-containing protein n=1 Tax=Nonomuraea wenchangensis TaxID=568860 RepID=A0A1I0LSF5_9ACTN|nr:WD domain-containing protein, G-beta repeat-containing protein [Nonomuraea wenchangensis]